MFISLYVLPLDNFIISMFVSILFLSYIFLSRIILELLFYSRSLCNFKEKYVLYVRVAKLFLIIYKTFCFAYFTVHDT